MASNKSQLAKTIREKVGLVEELSGAEREHIPRSLEGRTLKFIIDGGMLLHKTTWTIGLIFADICVQYLNVLRKFADVTVIFDGYQSSTKDMMHKKRKKDDCIYIYPGLDKKLSVSKVKFLSNNGNKSRFLLMLGNYLIDGITVLHAEKDADFLICREAVEWSNQVDVPVIGDETDLLVILLHMTKHFAFDHRLFLTTKSYIYDIEKIRSVLGRRHVNTILLCHAFTGSDTTNFASTELVRIGCLE